MKNEDIWVEAKVIDVDEINNQKKSEEIEALNSKIFGYKAISVFLLLACFICGYSFYRTDKFFQDYSDV